MAQEMVDFRSNGDGASGYLSTPEPGPGPGVVVIQEWWGLNEQIKRTADRLAQAGFSALVPDLYHGHVVGLKEPDEAGKALMALDGPRAVRDMRGAVDYLLNSGRASGRRVGCVGFCMGGALAVLLAANHEAVLATVDYYGGPLAFSDPDFSRIRGPVLGHFGEDDHHATVEVGAELGRKLEEVGVGYEMHTYPGADHAFTNEDRPEAYRPEAARLAWERTVAFLHRELDG